MGVKGAAILGLALALAGAMAACFADLSGFTDGAYPGDAALEASAPADTGVRADAASSTTTDAADDATDAGTVCANAGPHTLCDDFDTTTDAGWSQFSTFGGGSRARDLIYFVSPPASLGVATPTVASDAGEAWYLPTRKLPIATTHVRIEAQIMACNATGEYTFLTVNSVTAANAYGAIDVGIKQTQSGMETYLTVKHDALSKTYSLGTALPSTRFSHLVLETNIHKTAGSVKLSIDGTVVVDATNLSTDQSVTPSKRGAFAGVYSFASPACTVRLDDVVIDAD